MNLFALWRLSILVAYVFLPREGQALPDVDPAIRDGDNIFVTMAQGTGRVLAEISKGRFGAARVGGRRAVLHAALLRNAEESQAPLMDLFNARFGASLQVISFWITNQVYIRGAEKSVLNLLRGREDVSRIDKEDVFQLPTRPGSECFPAGEQQPRELGYNLELIGVRRVWAQGVNGSGIVIGNIDSGVSHTHEALSASYKNDSHSWLDTMNLPLPGVQTPMDEYGTGTSVTGLAVGGQDSGVAPGAKWIACKAYDNNGTGTESSVVACMEFMLAPTRPDFSDYDYDQAPHVVLNTWEASDKPNYPVMFNAWHSAGIIPVVASRIQGSGCSSLRAPAGLNAITVGATDAKDWLSEFSGQGPGAKGELKPELVAPGVGVWAPDCAADGAYALVHDEHSIAAAAAHVAGVIALLLSVDPGLEYEQLKQVLQVTAEKEVGFNGTSCAGVPDSEFPNFQFGHGRLDALAAYECVRDGLSCLPDADGAEIPWLLIAVVVGVVLFLAVPAFMLWRARRRRQRALKQARQVEATKKAKQVNKFENILHQFVHGLLPNTCNEAGFAIEHDGTSLASVGNYLALTTPYDRAGYEIPAQNLQIDEHYVLGCGEFGVVYSGFLRGRDDSTPVQVAVKKLKRSTNATCASSLLREVQIMIFVGKHENLVQLFGACTQTGVAENICIVLELCSNGNLEKYLRACRKAFTPQTCSEGLEPDPQRPPPASAFGSHALLQWTLEIASGMEFLTQKKVIHGDLACRNVLLDASLVAKVSDFGQASRLYEYTRYIRAEERPLPWRWMALESLQDMRYSHASDVWSFGITVWEVFSLAETPYPGTMWSAKFVQHLEAGLRNERPSSATEEIYGLLKQCWLHDPLCRPSMAQLRGALSRIHCLRAAA